MDNFGSNSNDLSHNGLITLEACRLVLGLNYFKVQDIPRGCNMVANKLARPAKEWDTRVWTNEAPSCIKDILAHEAYLWINSYFTLKRKNYGLKSNLNFKPISTSIFKFECEDLLLVCRHYPLNRKQKRYGMISSD